MASLNGLKVAILAAEGFEQAELTEPKKALEQAGAVTAVVSPAKGEVQGWKHFEKGAKVKVDVPLEQANAEEFDALLLPGGVVEGRTITSWPSLKTDLRNAGANWVDEEVVVDRGLVSSRKPADIPAFNRKMIEEFSAGGHASGAERGRTTSTPPRGTMHTE